jgi:thiol:disulfide interchange protein DsbD
MVSPATSTGSAPKPANGDPQPTRGRRRAVAVALAAAAVAAGASAQDPKLLPNERAFAFSARGLDARTVEARFVIADGYYLYRDKLRFSVEPGTLATVALPAGKAKEDAFFGRVETFRNQVVVALPLDAAAPGRSVTVAAESQGCADLGVCYPVQVQKVTVALPAAGGPPGKPVEAAPAKRSLFN